MAMEMKTFFTLLIFLMSFIVNIALADTKKILIVNTNTALQRYEKISTEFKNQLPKTAYQWVEFNIEDHENAESDLEKIISQEKPDIIYCIGSKAYSISQKQAKDEILLFSAAINWYRLNISEKTYGISNELSPGQEMMYLRMFFPEIKKIGILFNHKFNQEYIETVKKEAAALNIEIIDQQINDGSEINATLNELLPKVDLFWMISDPIILENKDSVMQIFQAAKQQHKPVYSYSDIYLKYGAVLSVSADAATIGRQAARLVMSLDESNSTTNNVKFPVGTTISLNMCVIDELKINLNKEALSQVNQLIPCSQK
jgi:putative ABC transport system substrate-binding protein